MINKQPSLARVADIVIYPLKSSAGLSLSSHSLTTEGLSFDRRFLVCSPQGQMLTGRTHPQLAFVSVSLTATGLIFSHPSQPSLVLNYQDFSREPLPAKVWNDAFVGLQTHVAADQWFSELTQQEVHLLYCGEQSVRQRSNGQAVSFADGYALMMISEASLAALNARCLAQGDQGNHQMAQFRPNLVIKNCDAFAEDSWARIRIGEVEFRVDSPCSRCVFTTLDLATGQFREDQQPLKALASFRQDDKGWVYFGMNLTPLNTGVLQRDAAIEVLAYQTPVDYLPTSVC